MQPEPSDAVAHCLRCGYNLTGLPSNVCPECGGEFHLDSIRGDPERRRVGSPVWGRRGLGLIPRTLYTAAMLVLRPRSFALRLRFDEPIGPAIAVFLLAVGHNCWVTLGGPPIFGWYIRRTPEAGVFAAVMVLLVLALALVLAVCSTRNQSLVWTFLCRFRFWCVVAMYSTVLLPLWPYFCAGIRRFPLWYYTTYWPPTDLHCSTEAYAATFLILWWTVVLSVVVWYRCRPRWLAIILMLVVFCFVRASVQIADACIMRLAR